MTRLDRIIFTICAWWRNRRIDKASPEIASIKRAKREAVRAHKPVKALRKMHKDAMTRALREGM